MHRIFVYGSLQRGQVNHGLLASSRCIGLAQTPPRYTLVDLGPYPGMLAEGGTAVNGEIYEATAETLAMLDTLEEHPRVYVRSTISLNTGESVETYLLQPHMRRDAPEIRSGRWPDRPIVQEMASGVSR